MIKNYLTIALRSLKKKPFYTGINVAGLALGLGISILFLLVAYSVLTFDRFHEHGDDTYLVYHAVETAAGERRTKNTWMPTLSALRQQFPQVVSGTRVFKTSHQVQLGDRHFEDEAYYVDPSFLDVFTFPLVSGDPATALSQPNAVVLTEQTAQRYFGDEDPMGQTLTLDGVVSLTVTGVVADWPKNSSLRFDLLANINQATAYVDVLRESRDDWGHSFLETYVRVQDDTSPAALEAALPAFLLRYRGEGRAEDGRLGMIRFSELYEEWYDLYLIAYILMGVALGILGIACINFTNMATARSLDRAREIGMRKVLGAGQGRLVAQFLTESTVLALIALVLGIGIAELMLPGFNATFGRLMVAEGLEYGDPWLLAALLGLGLITGVMAGAYPAFFLARFRPIETVKGRLAQRPGGRRLRQGLVVAQFVLTVLLVAAMLIVNRQTQFMKQSDFDFGRRPLVVVPLSPDAFEASEDMLARLETFRQELLRQPSVAEASVSSSIPGAYYQSSGVSFVGAEGAEHEISMRVNWVDVQYLDAYDLDLVEGRRFMPDRSADRGHAVLVNQATLRATGFSSLDEIQRQGRTTLRLGGTELEVVGVVEDFHYTSLREPIGPALHILFDEGSTAYRFLSVRAEGPEATPVLGLLRDRWPELGSSRAFTYFYADERFNDLYVGEGVMAGIVNYGSLLAILIASIGLLGIVSLSVAQRTKEIGIRKVLGASARQIVLLLTGQFARLVLLAILIGAPLAYGLMTQWLQQYAYRIDLGVGLLLLAGGLVLGLALVAVGVQAFRAALSDPIDALRYE